MKGTSTGTKKMTYTDPTINVTVIETRFGSIFYELDFYHDQERNVAEASGYTVKLERVKDYLQRHVPRGFKIVSHFDANPLMDLAKDRKVVLESHKEKGVALNDGTSNFFRVLNPMEKRELSDIVKIE